METIDAGMASVLKGIFYQVENDVRDKTVVHVAKPVVYSALRFVSHIPFLPPPLDYILTGSPC